MISPNSPLSDVEMLSSPVAVPFQVCSSQTASSELVGLEIHSSRKRKLCDAGNNIVKKSILENEVKKVETLKAIDSKLDELTETISWKIDGIVDCLNTLVSNQNRLIAIIANTPSRMLTNQLHPFQPAITQIPHAYQQQYSTSLPPYYQLDKD